jgi:hypothetical protein
VADVARDPISRLRTAIECLPAGTRRAMLEGIESHAIVAGAYTDGRGGICPMLAAHRHGGRTSFPSFARAWDAFTGTDTVRRVTPRELRVLIELLEASLDEEPPDLGTVIAEHREWVKRRQLAQPVIRIRRLKPARQRAGAARAARTAW